MHRSDLDTLQKRLFRSGVAPRYIARAISELRDHLEDVENEAAERGMKHEAAAAMANERLGAIGSIAQQYLSKPELRHWIYRYPRLASAVLPVTYVLALLAKPIHAGVDNASSIGKWCACLMFSAVVTISMLLLMQLSIALG
jgi:hypothetical protein